MPISTVKILKYVQQCYVSGLELYSLGYPWEKALREKLL